MSKYAIDETTLRDIADAIRTQTGKTDQINGSEMASEIMSLNTIPQEVRITGYGTRRFANNVFNWLIEKVGSAIITEKLTDCERMFYESDLEEIPFQINCDPTKSVNMWGVFERCVHLKSIPKITGCKPSQTNYMFSHCSELVELPDDIDEWFDWSDIDSGGGGKARNHMFTYCCNLRKIPMSFLKHSDPKSTFAITYLNNGFFLCYKLDELVGLPIPFSSSFGSSTFSETFYKCGRLKNLTFALDPNTNAPYVRQWSSQTIDLKTVGFSSATGDILGNSIAQNTSSITADKRVTDDATYRALKNDPDWWTIDKAYSRYNRDSAVLTINSLPDTSAYIATGKTPNTITFVGSAGSKTDGGAISTLTDSEIAVAAAKGWTVTFV